MRQTDAAAHAEEYRQLIEAVEADFRAAANAVREVDQLLDRLVVQVRMAVTAADSYRELIRWHGHTDAGVAIRMLSTPRLVQEYVGGPATTAAGVLRGPAP